MDAVGGRRPTVRWRAVAIVIAIVAGGLLAGSVVARGGSGRAARNDADVGFLRDMIDHHDQANFLSAVALRGTVSPAIRNVALDVVAAQRYEVGLMEGWLIDWDLERGAPDRDAMAWMGMRVSPATMPGMATRAELADLATMSGTALDIQFLELMIDHHRGGVHMAEAAAERAHDPHVSWLARRMTRNQRQEIRELETLLARIGPVGDENGR
jgi:uncharacterized protein (DUF305 family)